MIAHSADAVDAFGHQANVITAVMIDHGEIVGLGCQASMYAYERSEYETKNFARFLKAIGPPMSLKDLGLDTSDKGLKELVDCMMVVWGKRPEAHWPIIYDALQRIKE